MTTTSQNGWTINPPGMTPLVVNGVTFGPCHPGDAFTVLEYVATRYDREVEHLIKGTCGCYNPRQIPGSSVWSNHASATAIDCNWQRHPLGARGTYSSAQVAAIRRIVADCDGVIRWGGVYTTTVDEMHFEINKGAAAVTALAAKIRNEELPMDQAAFNQLMDGWSTTPAARKLVNGLLETRLGRSDITVGVALQNTESETRGLAETVKTLAARLAS